jgi:hypothetical protein
MLAMIFDDFQGFSMIVSLFSCFVVVVVVVVVIDTCISRLVLGCYHHVQSSVYRRGGIGVDRV